MSVQKVDFVKIKQEKVPYTVFLNSVIQNIHDSLALSVWVYLSSKPDDWSVNRQQLMDHFGIGRDKLGSALKYLNENKLINYIKEKDDQGKFKITKIEVKCGNEFIKLSTENSSTLLKNRSTVLPDTGKSAHIQNKEYIQITRDIQKGNFKQEKAKASQYVDRDTVSDEYRSARKGDPAIAAHYLGSMKGIRLARYNKENNEKCKNASGLVEK